ncbi:MAG: hypothetical protein ACHBN1_12350 [Heteroscytonema crispum UTEX LB 1556]
MDACRRTFGKQKAKYPTLIQLESAGLIHHLPKPNALSTAVNVLQQNQTIHRLLPLPSTTQH